MHKINLSYVVTTRNKITYLQRGMEQLLESIQEDEEIIVVDSKSTDGTFEYLDYLHKEGKIHHFISEPDVGEAHGYNKSFLKASGELIKIISDDDVFFYSGIQECKKFMLSNPEIDLLGTQGAVGGETLSPVEISAYLESYEAWKNYGKPFEFGNPAIMFRRSSLPLLGMYDTNFLAIDREFTCRATAGRANLAWFTAICWIHISNPESNSRNVVRMKRDMDKLRKVYGIDSNYLDLAVRNIRNMFFSPVYKLSISTRRKFPYLNKIKQSQTINGKINGPDIYFPALKNWLENQYLSRGQKFLLREKNIAK
jgi:glycosyltransferase involved in cell wall biosynthesis